MIFLFDAQTCALNLKNGSIKAHFIEKQMSLKIHVFLETYSQNYF